MNPADRRHNSEISSPSMYAAMLRRIVIALLLLPLAACGGPTAETDPLASIADDVNPDQRTPPQLAESWRRTFDDPLTIRPTVGASNVYLAFGNELAALRAADGESLWRVPLDSEISAAPLALGGQVVVGTAGDDEGTPPRILWIANDSSIAAQRPIEAPPLEIAGVPGTVVYIDGSSVGRLAGGIEWRLPVETTETIELSLEDGLVFVTAAPGRLLALDERDGTVRWEYVGTAGLTRPVIAEGRVYFGDTEGNVTSLHVADGKVAWQRPLGIGIVGGPVLTADLVWFAGLGAELRAFKAANGTIQHTAPLSSRTYLDMATYDPWVIVGPHRGPWVTVRGPTRSERGRSPALPGRTVQVRLPGQAVDLELAAGSGPAGVALVNGEETLVFLQLLRAR